MGEREVTEAPQGEPRRLFVRRLLDEVYALQRMLDEGLIESDVRRIGVEQEVFLADAGGRPARAALQILGDLDDTRFTTELALFQMEFNLTPVRFEGDCLSKLETEATELLATARDAAAKHETDVVLTGILPSLRKSDLGLSNMTPSPRYYELNRSAQELRGRPFDFHIKGVDELRVTHESVMLESCNASFQVHLQVSAEDFTRLYNASQFLAGPVLAAATNSPLLFGRRLWHETRIALFAQATDTRVRGRESIPRVHFGRRWLRGSIIDIYKDDIARFRTMISTELDEDPFARLDEGKPPELKALRLHNGTIWRWNRPCYGITDDKPHLRIENRILPAGPTVRDEIANAALWLGLMNHARERPDVADRIEFEAAKENFVAAARLGLGAQFMWFEDRRLPADRLILDELLPRAREGLAAAGVSPDDANRYLSVVEERVSSGRTGSRWALQSFSDMKTGEKKGTASERLAALTRAIVARQSGDEPGHRWGLAQISEAGGWKHHYTRVEQYMTTDLFTVREEDSVDLVANMMDWQHVRHVPVENAEHKLVGVVSYRSLVRLLAHGEHQRAAEPLPVSKVMKKNPITIAPETSSLEAIELMGNHGVSCLPVVRDGHLVGIVSERDFMVITRELLLQKLQE